MTDPAGRFFEELEQRGHVRLLEGATGTVLVEITDGEESRRKYVAIRRGDVSVSSEGPDPDCTIRTDAETFTAIVGGRMNAIAAVLRGKVEVDGKVSLLVALQSLFLPSAGAADQPAAGYAGRPT